MARTRLHLLLAYVLVLVLPSLTSAKATNSAIVTASTHVDAEHGDDRWSGRLKAPNRKRSDGPLQHIQTAYDRVTSADTTIVVHAGVYREQVQLYRPYRVVIRGVIGASGRPVITGADPIPATAWQKCTPTACEPLAGLRQLSAVHFSDLDFQPEQIFQAGVRLPRSRYPASGYLFPPTPATAERNRITDPMLASFRGDLTGATCHLRTRHHLINHMTVVHHDGPELSLLGDTRFPITENSGYFFTNVPAAIARPGDWAFDTRKMRLYLYPVAGLDNIEASRRDYAFHTPRAPAVAHEISGFSIQKTQTAGISISDSAGVRISGNLITDSFGDGIRVTRSDDVRVDGNEIRHANNFAVRVGRDSARAQITDNHIYATGAEHYGDDLVAGRGIAISSYSNGALISRNVIDRTGYDAIYLGSDVSGVEVSYNHIRNVMLSLSDGGAIYTGRHYEPPVVDTIHHNIIENAFGYTGGFSRNCSDKSKQTCRAGAHGIYLDERSSQRVVEHNTVVNASSGVFLHFGGDNQIRSNLFADNQTSQAMLKGRDKPQYRLQNNDFSDNTLLSRNKDQLTLTIVPDGNDFGFSRSNNNRFISPANDRHVSVRPAGRPRHLSLRDWQLLSGHDTESTDVASTARLAQDFALARVLLNPSPAVLDIDLVKAGYCDLEGTRLATSVRLNPFASMVVVPCAPP